jgi:hypothetical protein
MDWKLCEISGNWTASSESKSFWIFNTKEGAQLYQMNLFADEKLVGNFNNVEAAKLAAENLVSKGEWSWH